MDITRRFNQLIILVIALILTLCAKFALAENCYYGTETQHNLKDIQDLSQFTKAAEFTRPYTEFQYNGFSVSKSEYERLMLRDLQEKSIDDPNLRMP